MDPLPELPAQDQAVPPEALSRRTLLLLVLVCCVIALVSTLAMLALCTTARGPPAIITNTGPSSAHAAFTIGHPAPPSSDATGVAAFTIRDPATS